MAGLGDSRSAQAAYGKHLIRIGQLIPAVLYTHVMDRQSIAAAHTAGRENRVDPQAYGMALEYRDDLLEGAAVVVRRALICGDRLDWQGIT